MAARVRRGGEARRQKKLSENRAEQRRTAGSPPILCELTDIEERTLALVGTHNRSATRAALVPALMPPQPRAQALQLEPRQAMDLAVDLVSGGEEPHISPVLLQVLSTEDSEEVEEEPAAAVPSSVPAAMSSSTVEVAGPSMLLQGTPRDSMTAPTPRRLVRHSRSAPRSADLSADMVYLSRRNIEIGQQLLQAIGGISQQLATLSATMTEYMPRMAVALEVIARNTGARGLSVIQESGTAPQGAASHLRVRHMRARRKPLLLARRTSPRKPLQHRPK
uniref:uncharacterized protein n=1 Tax=Pristiophorus japonicus TaxID=55135 RepID=UPI00398E4BC2